MASFANVGAASKQIPLVCSVCPDSPRFSDVSHLLTHIASKGHLHHETQTKLKAHQDIASAVALQQYEQWYKENGIERLLVERMRAKQVKEAAKGRRSRTSTTEVSAHTGSRVRVHALRPVLLLTDVCRRSRRSRSGGLMMRKTSKTLSTQKTSPYTQVCFQST
jgi:hypothetical protein